MLKLVIFDCDGVLVDSEHVVTEVWHRTLKTIGFDIEFEKLAKLFMGISGKDKVRKLKEEYDLDLSQEFLDSRKKEANKAKAEIRIINGVDEMLDNLVFDKCLASGSIIESLNIYKQNNPSMNKHFDDRNTFSAEMVANGKPAPDLFLYSAEKMGYKPEECIIIEDSIAGVKSAVAAGIKVLGFTGSSTAQKGGEKHTQDLIKNGAEMVFANMVELPKILERLKKSY